MKRLALGLVLLGSSAACSSVPERVPDIDESSSSSGGVDAAANVDAAPVDKQARCAARFGGALTAPYGRLDGTVLALVLPGNEACTRPNRDHVIVQLLVNGEAYRVVVNVESDRGDDPKVRVREIEHTLTGPTFSEGWHTDAPLDYVDDLQLHSTDAEWSAQDLLTLVKTIEDAVTLDEQASAYVSTSGGDSAHLVHRNQKGRDGALVLGAASSAPRWLVFHFATQTF